MASGDDAGVVSSAPPRATVSEPTRTSTVIDDAFAIIESSLILSMVSAFTSRHARTGESRDTIAAALSVVRLHAADPLPRARDIAARVHDLDQLNRAHPGLTSGVEERDRLVGEIRRLMGAKC